MPIIDQAIPSGLPIWPGCGEISAFKKGISAFT
jgi:hypothetical protein